MNETILQRWYSEGVSERNPHPHAIPDQWWSMFAQYLNRPSTFAAIAKNRGISPQRVHRVVHDTHERFEEYGGIAPGVIAVLLGSQRNPSHLTEDDLLTYPHVNAIALMQIRKRCPYDPPGETPCAYCNGTGWHGAAAPQQAPSRVSAWRARLKHWSATA